MTALKFRQLMGKGSSLTAALWLRMAVLISSTAASMLRTARGKEKTPVPRGIEGGGALKERVTGR
jgi:hypothetical protein